jgi:hypothetical protein
MTASPVPWSRVQHTAERVAIVATGPSLKGVDLTMPPGVDVIAVNGALPHLPEPPRFWFTLDCSEANRAIMATACDRPETTFYCAAVPQLGLPDARPRDLRAAPEPCVTFIRRVCGNGPRSSTRGLSEDPEEVHAGNSAYGALGLAYLMGAKRIAILGVDGTVTGYAWGEGAPKDLQHLPWLFRTALPQLQAAGVEVVVGSPASTVDCWPPMGARDALDWLTK